MLEGTSSNTVEESQRLVKGLDELVLRLDAFEAKVAITEASLAKKGNELISDRSLSSSAAITSVNNPINDSPSNAYASNHLEETPMQLPETAIDDVASQGVIDVNAHQGSMQNFDEP